MDDFVLGFAAGALAGVGVTAWVLRRAHQQRIADIIQEITRTTVRRSTARAVLGGKDIWTGTLLAAALASSLIGLPAPAEAHARCRLGLVYRPSLHGCSHHRYHVRHARHAHYTRVVTHVRTVTHIVYRTRIVYRPRPVAAALTVKWAGELGVKRSDFK